MFSFKVSLFLSLICCALSAAVITVLRIMAAQLWLLCSAIIICVSFLALSARYFYAGKGRYQEHHHSMDPFKEYPLVIAALCFFFVAVLRLPQFISDGMVLSFLLVVAPFLAALACALRFVRGEGHPLSGPLALLPIFFLSIHLMSFYRANSNHPKADTFGYEIVVLSLLLWGLYMTSSCKYKLRGPILQRIYAMIPLSAVFMELLMLLVAPELLYQAEDLNAATLLSMAGASALLITPLFSPIQPVIFPESTADTEDKANGVEEVFTNTPVEVNVDEEKITDVKLPDVEVETALLDDSSLNTEQL